MPHAGIDLRGATQLTFWARGERGNEKIEFFVGGVGRDATNGAPIQPFPDSTPRVPRLGTIFTLSTSWTKYTINLSGVDLSYVLGGFGWVANAPNNPQGAVFWIDDIQYNKAHLDEPRFVPSYVTVNSNQPFDTVLRNVAFTYDNAITMLALMAVDTADGWLRAKIIADAFVYAQVHDRFYHDGRLRNAYQAGELTLSPGWTPNGKVDTVRMPGFWECTQRQWFEDRFQVSVHTGNVAWAMIALLTYYQKKGGAQYLEAARLMGEWIQERRQDIGFGGYRGGFDGWEKSSAEFPGDPVEVPWVSTEHNLDVFVAFTKLFQVTGEPMWQDEAAHARAFVEAMWDPASGCLLTGTKDAQTLNRDVLPLDAQAWSVLAFPDALSKFPSVLQCAENNHLTNRDGFLGFDFNTDKDGVWFEGTGQMAVAYEVAGQGEKAQQFIAQLRSAQTLAPNSNGKGLVAASHDGVTTGFLQLDGKDPLLLFARPHIAATGWYVFAELGMNPYALFSSDGGCDATQAGSNQLIGCVYDNTTLSGVPQGTAPAGSMLSSPVVATATALSTNWGGGGPSGTAPDTFSIRWKGVFTFGAGTYTFTVGADDGVRVKIDGVVQIEDWNDHPYREQERVVVLTAGSHMLEVEYYENGGQAQVGLRWVQGGSGGCDATQAGSNQLMGCVYDNTTLSGAPQVTAPVGPILSSPVAAAATALAIDWGGGGPSGTAPDTFSIRWKGVFTFGAGTYTFTVGADDGVRVKIDGVVQIEDWNDHPYREQEQVVVLTAGSHMLEVEYYENGGQAQVGLRWVQSGSGGCDAGQVGSNQLMGCVYDNTTLSGAPQVTAPTGPVLSSPVASSVTALATDWGLGGPSGTAPDTFSIRWKGVFTFGAGTYTFTVGADDGVRVKIDGVVQIEDWNDHPYREQERVVVLTGGSHVLEVEYYENGGQAQVGLRWVQSGSGGCDDGQVGSNQLMGCVYDNTTLSGVPQGTAPAGSVLSSPVAAAATALAIDWGGGGPSGTAPDTFSIRWKGVFTFGAGTYTFTVGADDGIRVKIDGVVQIEDWSDHPYREQERVVVLTGGSHVLEVEYYENAGYARIGLRWQKT